MQRKLTSLIVAMALVVALVPTRQTYAINREKYYTVTFVCIISPPPGVVGEWTKYCDGSMGGWGAPPYGCTPGNPSSCCETTVTLGPICDP